MALFSKNEKKEEKKARTSQRALVPVRGSLSNILRQPRITEKATMESGSGVYVFDISPTATKRDVVAAVQSIYKVRPRKVRVATIPAKNVRSMRTGKRGVKKGGRKAYIYLKKGETITIA
ncbi:50S ribosomal protein L23 [Candidatus Kaiserbacteria bacterium CG10_big_fil_rev_8_21_14_0_10_59_10]|uniref:Large ribosomal subunit protein uL23 n=1 Tax=Candidatus Kaiserbacteria bacterium CG10_big_fil_rev_8_21_14_0_10_59_10 TaxID=1974612 RepID=A0A2H0UAU5_9BACT|nr:MAG: 50S ribosomal protein L23 [Candidatus Kaiserbacteria bacterium CG10_big_fil_rev_8_21_14_0_10_59_10]